MAKEETRQSTKENLRLFLLDSLFQQVIFTTTHFEEKPWFETRIVMGKRSVAVVDDTNWDIILRSFFAYGEDIIPLAPQSFVDEWKGTVKKMAKSLGL